MTTGILLLELFLLAVISAFFIGSHILAYWEWDFRLFFKYWPALAVLLFLLIFSLQLLFRKKREYTKPQHLGFLKQPLMKWVIRLFFIYLAIIGVYTMFYNQFGVAVMENGHYFLSSSKGDVAISLSEFKYRRSLENLIISGVFLFFYTVTTLGVYKVFRYHLQQN